jgi:hypothetical protein
MSRLSLRHALGLLGGVSAALVALVLVFGVLAAPTAPDTTPSAVKKLYDPTDL